MTWRFLSWIWTVSGSVPLHAGQSSGDALVRLNPLFDTSGTTSEHGADTLTFRKKDAAAQDKLAIFDAGVLKIEAAAAGLMLRYRLTSRALLFCFLAPLLFLGIAQLTVVTNKLGGPAAAAKKKDKPKIVLPMNPIDKALGAPAPDKPDKKKADAPGGRDKKPTPTPAYVFAAIFAVLYIAGRILEAVLVRRLFARRLRSS